MKLHIIYTDNEVLLSKKSYVSWREIQDEFDDYKASLGPWGEDEVVQYLAEEYPALRPSAQNQVSALIHGHNSVAELSFAHE
jgi:isopentenyldiphosphate isomerase